MVKHIIHCRDNPNNAFAIDVNVVSPLNNSGTSNAEIIVYQVNYNSNCEIGRTNLTVQNNGSTNVFIVYLPLVEFNNTVWAKVIWSGSPNETTSLVNIITRSVSLSIAGSQIPAPDGGILLEDCHKVNGVVDIKLRGKGYICPGINTDLTLSTSEVDFETYQVVGNNPSVVLNQTQRSNLESGTFSYSNFCTSNNVTLSEGKRYRIELIMNNNSIWKSRTIYFMYKKGNSEVYIRDYWGYSPNNFCSPDYDDRGEERNRSGKNVFESPDVWNQLSNYSNSTPGSNVYTNITNNVGFFDHEAPDYSTTNTNFMFTKVNSMGCAATPNNVALRMYWTRARTGELYKDHWIYDMVNNYVLDNGNPQIPRPGGSEITISGASFSNPYNTSSFPVLIPSINPLGSDPAYVITPKAWYAPNPAWYHAGNGSMNGATQKPVICLLSETGIHDNHGNYDRIMWVKNFNNTPIEDYVRFNNNVATRNTTLMDAPQFLVGGGGTGSGNGTSPTAFHTVVVNNPSNGHVRLCLRNLTPNFVNDNIENYGELQIGFTNGLWNNWVANGMNGSGFEVISPTLFRVTDYTNLCFDNIPQILNNQEQFGLRMMWDLNACYPVDSPMFKYVLQMENMPNLVPYDGSDVIFYLPAHGPECNASGLREGDINTASKTKKDKISENELEKKSKRQTFVNDYSLEKSIILYPNPAINNAILTINDINDLNSINVSIIDVTGKVIFQNISGESKGNIAVYNLNTEDLVSGIYYIKIEYNNQTSLQKLVVNK